MADILQWNCRGLRTHSEHLKVLIRDHDPAIICLQETKLGNETYNPGLNYDMYCSPPPVGDRAKGGAAIIVKKSVQHTSVPLQTPLQAVAVNIISSKRLTVCSLYLPPDINYSFEDVKDLINQLPTPYMLLGDYNAHNPLWGGNVLDSKGKIIEDIIDSTNSALYNDGSMTYHNIYTNTYSVP